MGEMGRANRTNRCNRSNKVCEGCTYIQYRMRRELSVAVACPLWLDRWKLGRARVAAVRGMGARARSGWGRSSLWYGRWELGRDGVGAVRGMGGGDR